MMWSQPVQNMVKRRYLPKYIKEALTRMYDLYKNSKPLSDQKLSLKFIGQ